MAQIVSKGNLLDTQIDKQVRFALGSELNEVQRLDCLSNTVLYFVITPSFLPLFYNHALVQLKSNCIFLLMILQSKHFKL